MKKFMKKLAKKSEGFTLVELVVVIAILGILAGVAVPAYTGYITKANSAADITVLDAVATAAQAHNAKNGAITEIVVEDKGATGDTVTVKGAGLAAAGVNIYGTGDFKLFFDQNIVLKTGNKATWTSSTNTWAISGTAVAN